MQDDLDVCAQIVHRGDPDRFRSLMASPFEARVRLLPYLAFNVEVSRAPWITTEPLIAQIRLQWWRDALDEMAKGGDVRRHGVTTPLAKVVTPDQLSVMQEMIDMRQTDIDRPKMNQEVLFPYLDHTSGHVIRLCVAVLGGDHAAPTIDAGYALGLCNWLRALPALQAAGWNVMMDHDTKRIQELAQMGLNHMQDVKKQRIPKALRPAFLPLWQISGLLAKAKANPACVFDNQLALSGLGSHLRLLRSAFMGRF